MQTQSTGDPRDAGSLRGAGTSQEEKTSTYFSCVSSLRLWGLQPIGLTSETMSQKNSLPLRADCGPDFHGGCEVQIATYLDKYSSWGVSAEICGSAKKIKQNFSFISVSGGCFLSRPSIPTRIFPPTFAPQEASALQQISDCGRVSALKHQGTCMGPVQRRQQVWGPGGMAALFITC